MRNLKTFENWRESEQLKDINDVTGVFDPVERLPLDEFEQEVAHEIVKLLKDHIPNLKKFITAAEPIEYWIINITSDRRNQYGEIGPKNPEHFESSIAEMWENGETVEDCVTALFPGCLDMYKQL